MVEVYLVQISEVYVWLCIDYKESYGYFYAITNIGWHCLILVKVFHDWKMLLLILTDVNQYMYLNYKEYCLISVEHFYKWQDVYQYLTNINPCIAILIDTYSYWKQAICLDPLNTG